MPTHIDSSFISLAQIIVIPVAMDFDWNHMQM